jgi:flagellar motor component MotA
MNFSSHHQLGAIANALCATLHGVTVSDIQPAPSADSG